MTARMQHQIMPVMMRSECMEQALALVLQHPAISAAHICTLLQSSKSLRAVVQQSGARIDVSVKHDAGIATLAWWLPKHGYLVRSLSLNHTSCRDSGVAATALAFSLQAAAMHGSKAAAAVPTPAPAAGAAIDHALKPLELLRFSTKCVASPELLAALPAASLTELVLELPRDSQATSLAFAGSLGKLSNLRSLNISISNEHLRSNERPQYLPATLAPAIGQTGTMHNDALQ